MIDKANVVMMARYNAWQNRQLMDALKVMDEAALRQDRGAFFGSVFATLNHLLWGDRLWMSRWCTDVAAPAAETGPGLDLTPSIGVWQAERFALDGRMRIWAETLSNIDLAGDLVWYSNMLKTEVTQAKALCITHMFNHQTHHRGQVHAMLTQMGATPPVSDLVFMEEGF